MLWTFLYDGGFIVLRMSFPAYGGIKEMAPMANTRHTKPLESQSVADAKRVVARGELTL